MAVECIGLLRRRREYLDEVKNARCVLILGDCDGRFTPEFLGRNKQGIVDSVELSPRMLALAKQRAEQQTAGEGRIRFWQADARTMDLPRKYDLIVSHFSWTVLRRKIWMRWWRELPQQRGRVRAGFSRNSVCRIAVAEPIATAVFAF
ncbi:MAG TPA: class I SAM-dependent methyltransferase [Bryobacteraceae bacterium]